MAALLLTSANLHDLKCRLRAALPHAKSSHVSEALAAGLGYRTHAALLADMKASPDLYPSLVRTDDIGLADQQRFAKVRGQEDHAAILLSVPMASASSPSAKARI